MTYKYFILSINCYLIFNNWKKTKTYEKFIIINIMISLHINIIHNIMLLRFIKNNVCVHEN